MKPDLQPARHKIADTDDPAVAGHASWKRKKVEHGLEEAKGRDALIPESKLWRESKRRYPPLG